ncbi:MAG: putative serine-threonine protein kinase [Caulobacter sp.]|nr:putative serine-threonine protein kinase [Caulobacter sp.]
MRAAALSLAALTAFVAAPALADDATGVSGAWSGTYACGKVVRAMSVTLTGGADGAISGELVFGPGPKGDSASGKFHISGTLHNGLLRFRGDKWIEQPAGYEMIGFLTYADPPPPPTGEAGLSGTVLAEGCQGFKLRRQAGRPGGAVL